MRGNKRHTWLFSFTDTAFLLLLVYTQFGRLNADTSLMAEMRLPAPVVLKNSELVARKAQNDYSQILVDKHSERPFQLARITAGKEISRSAPMNFDELQDAFQTMRVDSKEQPRPVIVPLPESYSSDMLQVSSLVSKLWSEEGRAVVRTQEPIHTVRRPTGANS